ncbi:Rne/Rng family ribonuclease [Paracoccus sp. P2]|uniref:Ribonuclease E n=1 Tax=Paracoccus pantotrophus TaxID=82367 RepID=A0A7H9BPD8_PARPN|nr:ribonuclease E/G [Paracoccus pantotrophus]MDF3856092.1 Rne/Rng family ribonuclease [Paracoccus pantotrophus]QLH12956.1 Rne/Rng family ribonuclease [Paracoccus pantotrophus]RDD93378.1 ribonuclease E/G [Paracoccus pantotrophus]RNI14884.1 ribonuclease E/G [Paracoccus pantotrophus]WGR66567.1 ribonuclease E/G [Paracoccus pantotrophus]
MSKKMLIDATHSEETRVVVVDGTKVEEFDFETVNKRQLAGNIYLAKVTRVEPSLQAAFVDYGGNRHGFLAFAEIHPDYYQIPAADRKALIEEERQAAAAEADEGEKKRSPRRRKPAKAAAADSGDAVAVSDEIAGMAVLDHSEGEAAGAADLAVDVAEAVPPATAEDVAAPVPEAADEAAGDDAAEDDGIESVAEEDVAEEISPPRKPRARRYKIQEVIKVRQIMLVQVVKEERGNKGAALTTYLSLAGRYCVLMPNTARGGGISRKITNAADRKKLKEIASELEVPEGAGLIIRTAGSQRTRTEIRRDYEYLMRLWEQIRELTFKSIAPAPIYEEGDLIKRTIRDLYSKEIDEVLVEGERGYRTAKDFMKMIMPSHAKNVKHYTDQMPLFARYQVESYLGGMFNPVVQLKSGGYIVIGVTEALVAIDVNSGRATKEGSIEETALKTNLEAAEEIARQLRLRDLAGLIVIDFIDMEERKNNAAVEKRFKERLKTDRARIQVGRISGFGLMEMSRQRLRPGMLESTTQPCPHCHGTGLIRSDDSLALTILRAIEEEGTRKRSREVLVKAPVAVANFLMNAKREHIATIEARYGLSVRVEADPALISPDYAIEKFKTATRNVPEVVSPVVSVDARLMAQIDDEEPAEEEVDEVAGEEDRAEDGHAETGEGSEGAENGSKRRRRRRRRRGGKNGDGEASHAEEGSDHAEDGAEDAVSEAEPAERPAEGEVTPAEVVPEVVAGSENAAEPDAESAEKPRRRTRTRRRKPEEPAETAVEEPEAGVEAEPALQTVEPAAEAASADAAPAPQDAQAGEPVAEPAVGEAADAEAVEPAATDAEEAEAAEPATVGAEAEAAVAPEAVPAPVPEPVPEPAPAAANEEPARPKRRGWWSMG